MIKFPTQDKVVTAVINGVIAAHENFFSWTNTRLSLSHGPNKIISIHVAQEIGKIDDAPEIFIDATVADILRCSLPDREGFGKYMQQNGLSQDVFSITLDKRFEHANDNDSISKVIITIKNGVRNVKAEYTDEIARLCKMINRDACLDNSLDYAIFTFYTDISEIARKKLDKRIPEIIKSFDEVVKAFPTLDSKFVYSGVKNMKEKGQWCAGCYVIEPKPL